MMQQCVDQRAIRGSGGRVHDHANGLIDHHQIIVFKHHIQRNVLWTDVAVLNLRHCNFNGITSGNFLGLIGDGLSVYQHSALGD